MRKINPGLWASTPLLAVCGVVAALMMGAGLYLKLSGHLSPGPLSNVRSNNEPLGGYVSHAEFEKECGFCHAPVHCITDTRCQDCHIEIARQRATASGLHSLLPGTDRCQNCHVEHRGRDAAITELAITNINHTLLASFSLEQHSQDYDGSEITCESCHSNEMSMNETLDCNSCHVEANHAYMTSHVETYGTGCVDCHDGRDRMMNFDHNQYYLLDGRHTDLVCDDCHINKTYAATIKDCAGCHMEPELHAGIFGVNCASCHTSLAWAPAQFVQHSFVSDSSAADIAGCEVCHAGSYVEYPCYSCHSHDEMQAVHLPYEILDTNENCVDCHPNGRMTEAAGLGNPQPGRDGKPAPEVSTTGY